jgi:lysophospholipase L1-like esterase
MPSRRSAWRAAAIAAALVLLAVPVHGGVRCRGKHWVGAWATSPSDSLAGAFVDQSLRLVVTPTLGGARVRVRLSNRFGSTAVTLGAASIGVQATGAALVPGSRRTLRFAGKRTVTIPPGGEVASDPRRFRYAAFQHLAVTLHVTGTSGRATEHAAALQTSYLAPTGGGDRTGDDAGDAFTRTLGSWPFLTDVEVQAPRRVGAVVALGDSITDGFPGPVDGDGRYPDLLARRLAAEGGTPLAVQNEGISGNQILRDGPVPSFGPKLVDRLAHDTLDQAGARVVLLLEGTNDLGVPPPATAAAVIAGLQTIVDRLHAAGLRVILATQTPCNAFALAQHGTPAAIAARNQINDWIRTSGAADGVVDFHAALRDPDDPDRLLPAYDSGDHLHPSAAGYAAMADAVDLGLLRTDTCRDATHP